MPIEFRCQQCEKLLRTPDDTAGKQAKCPDCGAVMQIPDEPHLEPPPPRPLEPQPRSESPFGPDIPPPGAPGTENPYQSPADYAAPPLVPPPGTFAPSRIDFSDVLGRTWRIFRQHWGECMLVFVVVVILILITFGTALGVGAVLGALVGSEAITVVFTVLAACLAGLFAVWIGIGQRLFFLKMARGEETSLGELFCGGPFFLNTLLAGALFALANLAGLMLCIVPGIIVALMFSHFHFLIIDRNVDAVESLSLSKQVTHGNKLMLLAIFMTVVVASSVINQFTCNLGALVTAPFMSLLSAVVYLVMTGQATADQKLPGAPGPFGPPGAGSPFAAPETSATDELNIGRHEPNSP